MANPYRTKSKKSCLTMKITELLYEAVEKLSVEDFPIISKNIPEKRLEWFEKSIETINTAIDNNRIDNPRFKDLKDTLNRTLELAAEKVVADPYFRAGRYQELPDDLKDIDYFLGLHNSNARMKSVLKLEKKYDHPLLVDYKALLQEALKLATTMEYLKTINYKKEKRSPEEIEAERKQQFHARVAHADVKKIHDLLTEITQDVRAKVLAANIHWLVGIVEGYLRQYNPKDRNTDSYHYYNRNPFARELVGKVITYVNNVEDLKPNYETIIKKEGEKITAEMLEHFIVKNTTKLSAIATAKNNLKDVTILKSETARGVVEGVLKLTFLDNSEFTVDNKVVMSVSKYGKPFYRFPTTFHNVVMPDGTKMKGVSEESMNELFAKSVLINK